MSFRLPNFNISVNIWRYTTLVSSPPDVTSMANLTPGRRVFAFVPLPASTSTGGLVAYRLSPGLSMQLLLPALTDIRYSSLLPSGAWVGDCVEAPAGSGRYYAVWAVDDAGKGFANEHRVAILYPLTDWVLQVTTNPWGATVAPFPLP